MALVRIPLLCLLTLAGACAVAPPRSPETAAAGAAPAEVPAGASTRDAAPAPSREDAPASIAEPVALPSEPKPAPAEPTPRGTEVSDGASVGDSEPAPEAETHHHLHQGHHAEPAEHAGENVVVLEALSEPDSVEPPPPAQALPKEEVVRAIRPEVVRGNAVIAGRVELIQAHPVPAGPGQLQRTWVAFRPNRGRHRAAPMEEQRIITRQSQFQPQALMITVGTTVRFPNFDRIQHNVFSLSPGNRFDVGLYGPNEGVAHTFLNPGVVYVYCNIHPNMAAFIWVVDTPYFAQLEGDGSFRIEGVPEGGGILEVWNHRAELYRFPVVAPDTSVRVALRLTKPPVLQHTNKFGRPY